MARLRIFLAINGGVLREGLKKVITDHPGMCVIGHATNQEVFFEKIAKLLPDVVIITQSFCTQGVAETVRPALEQCPRLKVIVLSAQADGKAIRAMSQCGVHGHLPKTVDSDHLIDAIKAVFNGGKYFAHVDEETPPSSDNGDNHSAIDARSELSTRETTVVRMVAEGHTNREIADKLHISVKSVETYRSRSVSKLGLHNRADFVRYALERGWLRSRPER